MTILVNKKIIKAFNFSGGESQISIAGMPIDDRVEVCAFLNTADEIMRLLLTVDAIRRINPAAKIDLHIPYFPYARQDRVCNVGEAMSVEVMAQLINNLSCESVTIEDPHSSVTADLIKNVRVLAQADILSRSPIILSLLKEKNFILLAPDKGAALKTEAIAAALNSQNIPVKALFATKVRDVTNGKITETLIPDGIEGKNILVPDDICDGGSTFIELAKKLKAAGANDLYLYVTHGIFSRGLGPLREGFTHVFCRNCFINNENPNFLTILEDI
ncbi:MAG: ribose-phosphate pyrophosphokinase [Alphaproteobacteria bacterium]|nr:ribose-phosphate pyrophosphokinase [Alphaproteobacteria bacterium]